MATVYTSKEITGIVFSRKKIKDKAIEIKCDSVFHVPGKNIIELYLKFRGVDSIVWSDKDERQQQESLLGNVLTLLLEALSFPFSFLYVVWMFWRMPSQKKYFSFPNKPSFLYLRTDHWFKLTSGGSVGHVSGVVNELNKLNFLTKLITTDRLFEIDKSITQTIISPSYRIFKNIPDFPALIYNIQLLRAQHLMNLAHINALYQRLSLGNFFGVYLKYKKQIPLILEFNGSEIWASEKWGGRKLLFLSLYKKIETYHLTHADLIVVVSAPLKEELIGRGIAADRILINPNGVNTDKFDAQLNAHELRASLGLSDKKVFGFIGTFAEWHGVLVLAHAIVSFYNQYPQYKDSVRFLLIGSGNLLQQTKQIIEAGGYAEQVVFADKIEQHKAPMFLAACDYFLSPHVPNPDGSKFFGSPTKLFEYMAMAKPIIASDLDQIGEILRRHDAALLVPPGDAASLARAMNILLEDQHRATQLAQHAYEAANKHYTWHGHVQHILSAAKTMG